MSPSAPVLTIVTVVKDDPEGLALTRGSIVGQWTDRVEHVVVDSSADRATVHRILTEAPPPVRYRWEQPAGIYPAMNSSLDLVSGDYVLFLNAGDRLLDGAVGAIEDAIVNARPLWAFGQVRFTDPHGTSVLPEPFDYSREKARLFAGRRFPPHQGTFTRSDSPRELGGFDTSYRIAADYKVMLQLSRRDEPLQLRVALAEFRTGGASSVHWRRSVGEFHRARCEVLAPRGWTRIIEQSRTLQHLAALGVNRVLA